MVKVVDWKPSRMGFELLSSWMHWRLYVWCSYIVIYIVIFSINCDTVIIYIIIQLYSNYIYIETIQLYTIHIYSISIVTYILYSIYTYIYTMIQLLVTIYSNLWNLNLLLILLIPSSAVWPQVMGETGIANLHRKWEILEWNRVGYHGNIWNISFI